MEDCLCAMKVICTDGVTSFMFDLLCPSHIQTPAFVDVIEINLSFIIWCSFHYLSTWGVSLRMLQKYVSHIKLSYNKVMFAFVFHLQHWLIFLRNVLVVFIESCKVKLIMIWIILLLYMKLKLELAGFLKITQAIFFFCSLHMVDCQNNLTSI